MLRRKLLVALAGLTVMAQSGAMGRGVRGGGTASSRASEPADRPGPAAELHVRRRRAVLWRAKR
jgi:hypothetical protein